MCFESIHPDRLSVNTWCKEEGLKMIIEFACGCGWMSHMFLGPSEIASLSVELGNPSVIVGRILPKSCSDEQKTRADG